MISWIEMVGLVGGVLSCASFVPQLIKLFRERTAEGISRRMYFVTVSAFAIWTLYGVLVDRSAFVGTHPHRSRLNITALLNR